MLYLDGSTGLGIVYHALFLSEIFLLLPYHFLVTVATVDLRKYKLVIQLRAWSATCNYFENWLGRHKNKSGKHTHHQHKTIQHHSRCDCHLQHNKMLSVHAPINKQYYSYHTRLW